MIASYLKTSFVDYPNRLSAVVFFRGCQLNCGYCHNWELLDSQGLAIDWTHIYRDLELKMQRGLLDAVVFSGGEAALTHSIIEKVRQVKEMGFLVKLDTNGGSPQVLQALLDEDLVDYIALDIKGNVKDYSNLCGLSLPKQAEDMFYQVKTSLTLLMKSGIDYEIRTTMIKPNHDLCHMNELLAHLSLLSNRPIAQWYLQQCMPILKQGQRVVYDTYSALELDHIRTSLLQTHPISSMGIRAQY